MTLKTNQAITDSPKRRQETCKMKNMMIRCGNMEEFVACIGFLVRDGLTFNADSSTLEIQLLGGF